MTRCRVIVKGLFRSFYVSLWLERCLGKKKSNRIGTWFWVFISLNVFRIFKFWFQGSHKFFLKTWTHFTLEKPSFLPKFSKQNFRNVFFKNCHQKNKFLGTNHYMAYLPFERLFLKPSLTFCWNSSWLGVLTFVVHTSFFTFDVGVRKGGLMFYACVWKCAIIDIKIALWSIEFKGICMFHKTHKW